MNKKYVWGCGKYGRLVYENLSLFGINYIDGFIDTYKKGSFLGLNIINPEDIENDSFVIVAMNDSTEPEKYLQDKKWEPIKDYIVVNKLFVVNTSQDYADLYGNRVLGKISNLRTELATASLVSIGNNVRFGENVLLQCKGFSQIVIGDDCFIDDNVSLVSEDCSKIIIKEKSVINKYSAIAAKNDSTITLNQGNCIGTGSEIAVGGMSILTIGDNTDFDRSLILRANKGTRVEIGEDCMFSYNVSIRGSQGHEIIREGVTSSNKEHVIIGKHVWIGMNVSILPGTIIGDGSVVGAASLLNKEYGSNKLIVGNPAICKKNEIEWKR